LTELLQFKLQPSLVFNFFFFYLFISPSKQDQDHIPCY